MMIAMWKLSDAIQTKKRIIYVEVLSKTEKIDRQTSKQNLNVVVETFMNKRKFSLFDKFWYLKRAENFDYMTYRGVHIDGLQCVELDLENYFQPDINVKAIETNGPDFKQYTHKSTNQNAESLRYLSAEQLDAYDESVETSMTCKKS